MVPAGAGARDSARSSSSRAWRPSPQRGPPARRHPALRERQPRHAPAPPDAGAVLAAGRPPAWWSSPSTSRWSTTPRCDRPSNAGQRRRRAPGGGRHRRRATPACATCWSWLRTSSSSTRPWSGASTSTPLGEHWSRRWSPSPTRCAPRSSRRASSGGARLRRCRDVGVHLAQGYAFGRPGEPWHPGEWPEQDRSERAARRRAGAGRLRARAREGVAVGRCSGRQGGMPDIPDIPRGVDRRRRPPAPRARPSSTSTRPSPS